MTIRLTELTACGGCAAKWAGAPLRQLVAALAPASPDLLVGLAPFDDAAVMRLTDDLALVSTTDFFPPLVDDPADYGAIAAANACSDVFAMGGRVTLALNVAAFPETVPVEVIAEIFSAAAEVVTDAGGHVAGGHTIRAPEPVFGLAVQGLVHPSRIWTKGGARPGDHLVLSKPVGTGLVLAGGTTAQKAAAIDGMRRLNRSAAEQLGALAEPPHAVTDVTGFGLAGHSWEIADRSGVEIVLDGGSLPAYEGALEAARHGARTGGDERNRQYLGAAVRSGAADDIETLVFDPQTSGGLLAAVDAAAATELVGQGWFRVGEVAPGAAAVVIR